jgi:hypothetical protein
MMTGDGVSILSGRQLLVVEFMRPGLTLDRDHLYRFQTYIDVLRAAIRANSALGFEIITGLARKIHEELAGADQAVDVG